MKTNFHKKQSLFIPVFLVVLVVGYGMFFTSSIWYQDRSDLITATKLNTASPWQDREIKVMRWDFSEDQKLCEVELDIKNKKYDGIDDYDFEAITSNGHEIFVKKVIEEPDFIVLHLEMPKKWKEISLRIRLPEEYRDNNSTTLKLYGTIDSVTKVDDIKERSLLDYQIRRLDETIHYYQEEIESNSSEITNLIEKTNHMSSTITDLEQKKQYQTEQEKAETDHMIESTKSDKQMILDEIENIKNENKELEERIDNIQDQIKKLKQ